MALTNSLSKMPANNFKEFKVILAKHGSTKQFDFN
jgi:hypothetical protein